MIFNTPSASAVADGFLTTRVGIVRIDGFQESMNQCDDAVQMSFHVLMVYLALYLKIFFHTGLEVA